MVKNIKNEVKKMEHELNLGGNAPPSEELNFPLIQVTNKEKDRTVISFNNTENVIDGIEVIRPDENPITDAKKPTDESPAADSQTSFAREPNGSRLRPVEPKIMKIDEILKLIEERIKLDNELFSSLENISNDGMGKNLQHMTEN